MTAARKLILTVSVLHSEGFGNLRLNAGMSPSGCYWRFLLHPTGRNQPAESGSLTNQTSLGWDDSEETSPEELAEIIRTRFPEIMKAARREDSAYASWLKTIIETSEPQGLFIEYWDSWDGKCDDVGLINCTSEIRFPKAPL